MIKFDRTGAECAIKLSDGSTVPPLKPKDSSEDLFIGDKVKLYSLIGVVLGTFTITSQPPGVRRFRRRRLSHEPSGGISHSHPTGGCVLSNGQTVKLRYLLGKVNEQ